MTFFVEQKSAERERLDMNIVFDFSNSHPSETGEGLQMAMNDPIVPGSNVLSAIVQTSLRSNKPSMDEMLPTH